MTLKLLRQQHALKKHHFLRRREWKGSKFSRFMLQAGVMTVFVVCFYGVQLFGQSFGPSDDVGMSAAPSNRRLLEEMAEKSACDEDWEKSGGAAIYFLGVLYTFLALAIICDEYFVASLEKICEALDLSEDVAGATFMAAGSSAPELFTSIIGVFFAKSDVGIGTIVGSAVFNILIIIAVSAALAGTVLHLDWRPLARDCSFYSASIILLVIIFIDHQVDTYEAVILLCCYVAYLVFMKFNEQILSKCAPKEESPAANLLEGAADSAALGDVEMQPMGGKSPQQISEFQATQPTVEAPPAMVRRRSSSNPIHMSKFKKGALAIIFSLSLMKTTKAPPRPKRRKLTMRVVAKAVLAAIRLKNAPQTKMFAGPGQLTIPEGDEEPEGLVWPDSGRERFMFIISLPILLMYKFTIPDCRYKAWENWYIGTFAGSIAWIGIASFFMVDWATQCGNCIGLPPDVMGLTIVAAGTSVPDALSSVIVARDGAGDMAVSNAIGSNVFDILLGLGFPWFLSTLIYGKPVPLHSEGMVVSIIALFLILFLVVGTIALFGWKLTPRVGATFLVLYVLFVVFSLIRSSLNF
eukprot:GFYU01008803.1.p1 GENE.GFYU01008803.1~~GFYU01008803.1.p1  ORF type:complete len:579 (-),score=165.85 GFYU01008803.1:474-2210(-)